MTSKDGMVLEHEKETDRQRDSDGQSHVDSLKFVLPLLSALFHDSFLIIKERIS